MGCNSCVLSHFSRVQLFVTLWTTACQPPLSMRFSRQDSWSGLPYSPPKDFPSSGLKPMSLMSLALAGGFFNTGATWEAPEWSKDLNLRLDARKLLEKNTGRTPFDINHSNIFLDPSPRVMEIKTNKWDLIEHKRFA